MTKLSSRKKGKPLSTEEKWMVVNVYSQCDQERTKGQYTETEDAHTRTSKYTGIGRRQVVDIIRYYNETGHVPIPARAGNRTVHQTNIPSFVEEQIRKLILDSAWQRSNFYFIMNDLEIPQILIRNMLYDLHS